MPRRLVSRPGVSGENLWHVVQDCVAPPQSLREKFRSAWEGPPPPEKPWTSVAKA
ncbi:hypothetical protein SAMN06272765_7609 [Streptomyces sp. Ag109_G2-15]|nr:hypothetical protein SAMN06272765_7609 [Streptomyces sp. Ag109_G2-15]